MKTVLHYCAENTSLNCAEIVLSAAPDIIDVADEDGYTTLHLAVIAGNLPLVNFLISKLADINALDAEQHSVIHWATGKLLYCIAFFKNTTWLMIASFLMKPIIMCTRTKVQRLH